MDRHRRRFLQGSGGRRPRRQGCRQVPARCRRTSPSRRSSRASIDVLAGNVALTSRLETELGIRFPGVLVFDGPGLHGAQVAGRRQRAGAVGRAHLRDGRDRGRAGRRRLLRGARRCPSRSSGSTGWQDAVAAYINKSCQVLSADVSVLAQARQQSGEPDKHMILPEVAKPAADRARDAAGRRGLVQRRALDHLCADRGRGARHHLGQRRRHEGLQERQGAALAGPRHGPRPASSASAQTGRSASSARSATTASCSSATSGSSRP